MIEKRPDFDQLSYDQSCFLLKRGKAKHEPGVVRVTRLERGGFLDLCWESAQAVGAAAGMVPSAELNKLRIERQELLQNLNDAYNLRKDAEEGLELLQKGSAELVTEIMYQKATASDAVAQFQAADKELKELKKELANLKRSNTQLKNKLAND